MQTPTHLLVAAAALARPAETSRDRWVNAAVLIGALLPDLSIYILFAWARFMAGYSEAELWSEIYWQEPWQSLGAISNSFPVFAALALAAAVLKQRWLLFLAIAALLHLALDFPLHHDDAHIHFWPLSDWRFESPISYWDDRHFGDVVIWVERIFGLVLTVMLWRRFTGRIVRAILVSSMSLYFLVPLYFTLMLG